MSRPHPVVRACGVILGPETAAWWNETYPGRMTVARARWAQHLGESLASYAMGPEARRAFFARVARRAIEMSIRSARRVNRWRGE